MLLLNRTVRFCLNDPPVQASPEVSGDFAVPRHNNYSAWPPMRGLGRYYELRVACEGLTDPVTGYLLNIKRVDEVVHHHLLPYLQRLLVDRRCTATLPMGWLMRQTVGLMQQHLGVRVCAVTWALSRYYELTIRCHDMDHVTITQRYEFSAAHRLHVPQYSDEKNQQIFGKCNNPSGHGHNYQVQVGVRAPIDPLGNVTPVEQLDAVVDLNAIQKLDHKHLNTDVPQFAAINPSVENITQVIYQMLEKPVADLGLELEEVSVWETEKTVCTYRGPDA